MPRNWARWGLRGLVITTGTLTCSWCLTAAIADASSPAVTSSTVTSVPASTSTALSGIVVSGFEQATNPLLVTVSTTTGTLSMNQTTGLTIADGYSFSGDATFTFTGDEADVNNGLASLALLGTGSEGTATVTVNVSEEPDLSGGSIAYDSGTGHYYQYVPASNITWGAADTDAQALSFDGQTGYLAAIPNSAVNTFITDHLNGAQNVWAGGQGYLTDTGFNGDANVERYWEWVGGPWANQVFTECSNWTNTCVHVDDTGDYYDWNTGEPNNSGGGQDQDVETSVEVNYQGAGDWNDLSPNGSGIDGYVVEFGDQTYGGDFTGYASSTSTVTLTTVPQAPTAVSAQAQADSAWVTWTAPTDYGDSPITGYVVTPYIGSTPLTSDTFSGSSTSADVVGLSAGQGYTFVVQAVNADGDGAASTASTSVTPYAPPVVTTTSTTTSTTTTVAPSTTTVPSAGPPAPTTGGVASTPGGQGYWALTAGGKVASHGDAATFARTGGSTQGSDVVGVGSTSDGGGYWLTGANGSVSSYGDARFFGSMSGHRLNGAVVQVTGTPDNGGYWLVGADGGVFNFGDAHFFGSLGSEKLASPVVGMAPSADGGGYLLAEANGAVYKFGDALSFGSMAGRHLNQPIVGIVDVPGGNGYWLVGADGGVFSFGSAHFYGSLGHTGGSHIVAMIANGDLGYRLISASGEVYSFGTNP